MGLAFNVNVQAPEIKQPQCSIENITIEEQLTEKENILPGKTKSHIVIKKYLSPLGTNCVNYVKSKKQIPNGLGTMNQKISKITNKKPEKGKIGVTKEGPVGHMVFVEEVKEETLIISEGNWLHGYITWREIPKSLVIGYL